MKKLKVILFVLPAILFFTDMSEPNYYYNDFTPVLMNREELEKSIYITNGKPLEDAGKIYTKDSLIFISEKFRGIHVINNANPAKPKKTGFINAPGCVDMAVKGTVMYLDNSVDLVAVDLSKYPEIKVTERIRNIFPEPLPPGYDYIPDKYLPQNRPKQTVIVRWIKIGETY